MNRFVALRRSQLVIAIYAIDRELLARTPNNTLSVKPDSVRDVALRQRRALLLDALQIKDAELLAKFAKAGFSQC